MGEMRETWPNFKLNVKQAPKQVAVSAVEAIDWIDQATYSFVYRDPIVPIVVIAGSIAAWA